MAQAVVAVHFAFLGYVIAGGFLAWRWRRALWPHLAACAWAVAIVTLPFLVCPLTQAENWARSRGGLQPYVTGFIDHHVEGVLYPAAFTPVVQVAVGLVVVTSWVGLYLRRAESASPADVT